MIRTLDRPIACASPRGKSISYSVAGDVHCPYRVAAETPGNRPRGRGRPLEAAPSGSFLSQSKHNPRSMAARDADRLGGAVSDILPKLTVAPRKTWR
jgi:hypothetical protein